MLLFHCAGHWLLVTILAEIDLYEFLTHPLASDSRFTSLRSDVLGWGPGILSEGCCASVCLSHVTSKQTTLWAGDVASGILASQGRRHLYKSQSLECRRCKLN